MSKEINYMMLDNKQMDTHIIIITYPLLITDYDMRQMRMQIGV